MKTNSFIFYDSFFQATDALNEEEELLYYRSIIQYALFNLEVDAPPIVNALIGIIKPILDSHLKNKNNGLKGGRPKKITPLFKKNNPPLEKVESKVKVKVKVNNYDTFLEQLKNQVSIKSKVTKTKEGAKLFKKIKDIESLRTSYISHQLEKKEFSQRITPFMEDYKPTTINEGYQHNNTQGGYTF